jgi:PAS domain S-box-containing protein
VTRALRVIVAFAGMAAVLGTISGASGHAVVWYLAFALNTWLGLAFGWRYALVLLLPALLGTQRLDAATATAQWPPLIVVAHATCAAGAGLVLREVLQINPRLRRWRDVLLLLLVGVFAAPLVAAMIAAAGLLVDGLPPRAALAQGGAAFVGGMAGAAVVLPFLSVHGGWLVAWVSGTERPTVAPRRRWVAAERFALAATTVLATWAVFALPIAELLLFVLCLLPLKWAALRYGLRGATVVTLVTGVVMLLASGSARQPEAIEIQLFTVALALTGLALGVAVTSQQRAVRRLRRYEAELRHLLDQMPIMVDAYLPGPRFVFWNRECERVTGYSAEEVLANPQPLAQFYPDTSDRALMAQQAQERGLAYRDVEWNFTCKDGTTRIIAWSSLPGTMLAGSTVRWFVGRDVTAQRQAEARLRLLAEASERLAASLDYQATIQNVADLVIPTIADWCFVDVLINDELRRVVAAHSSQELVAVAHELQRRFPLQTHAHKGPGHVIATGEIVLHSEVSDEMLMRVANDDEHLTLMRRLGLRSIVAAPLAARGRTLGAITFGMAESGRRYTSEDLSLVEELARRASLAVDNARLYHDAQRRAAELATVQHVARAINSTLQIDTILQEVVRQVSTAFGYRLVSIYMLEGDQLLMRAQVGYGECETKIDIRTGVSGRVARTGQAAFVGDARAEPEFIYDAPGISQAIIVPLRGSERQVVGTLTVESDGTPVLTGADVDLLMLMADQISLALTNARLFAELRRSEDRYRALVSQAVDGIAVTDVRGRTLDANAQLAAMLGATRQELIGGRMAERIAPEDLPDAYRLLARVQAGERLSFPLQLVRPNGERVPVEISAGLVNDDLILAIVRDVSERQRLEAQLRQSHRLEVVGTLASGIAHDFNNILAAIVGFADLLRLSLPEDAPHRYEVDQIARAALRGNDLIRKLLAFSRSGPIERRPTDLAMVVMDTCQMLRATLTRAIELRYEPEPVWTILADPAQMQQVVMNLIVNARDALVGGGIITVTSANLFPDDPDLAAALPGTTSRFVRLCVADTGVGMDAKTLHRVFEPFFTTKEQGKGTGLGMSIVHGIVQSHGGVVTVHSELGCGTKVSVFLPVPDSLPEDQPATVAATE